MSEEPDLSFDIDALFEHLTGISEDEESQELDWVFSLSSPHIDRLEAVAEELESDFEMQLIDNVEVAGEDGQVEPGDPTLMIVQRGELDASQVKSIANRLDALAKERDLRYEGVEAYDPVDEQEIFGWLDVESAAWRMRHMEDIGVEADSALPWAFLVSSKKFNAVQKIASELEALGFAEHECYDEPDEEGNYGACVFVEGRNNEGEFLATAEKIVTVAESNAGSLIGAQFYTRDDVADVFGLGEED